MEQIIYFLACEADFIITTDSACELMILMCKIHQKFSELNQDL